MKNRRTFIPMADGSVFDKELNAFRPITLYELLDRIAECEYYCRLNASMLDCAEGYNDDSSNDSQIASCLDSMAYFGQQAQECLELINAGKYGEVNNYAV